jgi:hypothetical protein
MKPPFTSPCLALILLITAGSALQAGEVFTVNLTTTPLTTLPGSSAGPFSLALQLVQGSQPNNNAATISAFDFGIGGSAGSGCPTALSPCIFGDASGDLSSTVLLNTSQFFNAFIEFFNPGSSLSFQVELTTNVDSGGVPDAFAFSILDSGGSSIPTLDPSTSDTLLTVNIDSSSPAILTYATDPSRLTNNGAGVSITMDAPTTAPVVAATPEPGSLSMDTLGAALIFVVGCRVRVWRRQIRCQ